MVDFCFIRKPDKSPFAFITFSTMEEAEKGKEYVFFYLDFQELSFKGNRSGCLSLRGKQEEMEVVKEDLEPVINVNKKDTWLEIVPEVRKEWLKNNRINSLRFSSQI